jgi:hypothetical protein
LCEDFGATPTTQFAISGQGECTPSRSHRSQGRRSCCMQAGNVKIVSRDWLFALLMAGSRW